MKALLEALAGGRIVAAASESFFGLFADAGDPRALDRLFSLKPRDLGKGVPIVLPGAASWHELARDVPETAQALGAAFWPGALSIALEARAGVDPRLVEGGRIAVRVPGPSPALELVRAYGRPLTATSANHPGEPPATRAEQVEASFPEAVAAGELIALPGESPGGAPSTVVVLDPTSAWLARDGRVPRSELAEVLARSGISLTAAGSGA